MLYEETQQWDVPLMVTRGFSSLLTSTRRPRRSPRSASPTLPVLLRRPRPVSGVDITRKVEQDLREFAPDAEIHFERVAVTPEQIVDCWTCRPGRRRPPTRGVEAFEGESVEVDAIDPDVLRTLVRRCVAQHIDTRALGTLETIEAEERATLSSIVDQVASWGRSA